jgi:YHS domain-containing protein
MCRQLLSASNQQEERNMNYARFTWRRLLTGSLLALLLGVAAPLGTVGAQPAGNQRIGLDGYCPVCIIDAKKWVKGSPDHAVSYDGVTYHFPNDTIKQEFLASPAKYVPALGGDCIVCFAKLGKHVPGSIQHAARADGRLYLFPGDEQQQAFLKNPKEFANVDLALGGECAVCLVKANKHVPGKAEFTEIHNGLRYQFPSANEQAIFRKDPAHYAAAAAKGNGKSSANSERPADQNVLTVTGQTACAGCEYGVTPIQNPEELGLAVKLADDKVVVVEHAHQRYSSVYESRFTGQRVRVSGRVLKQEGRFTWLEPTELTVLK